MPNEIDPKVSTYLIGLLEAENTKLLGSGKALADLIGISRPHFGHILEGEKGVGVQSLKKIAAYFRRTPQDIVAAAHSQGSSPADAPTRIVDLDSDGSLLDEAAKIVIFKRPRIKILEAQDAVATGFEFARKQGDEPTPEQVADLALSLIFTRDEKRSGQSPRSAQPTEPAFRGTPPNEPPSAPPDQPAKGAGPITSAVVGAFSSSASKLRKDAGDSGRTRKRTRK